MGAHTTAIPKSNPTPVAKSMLENLASRAKVRRSWGGPTFHSMGSRIEGTVKWEATPSAQFKDQGA
jgi:hypothetical protein